MSHYRIVTILYRKKYNLKNGVIAMTFQTWYKTWSVKVDIKPLFTVEGWANILHMTTDYNSIRIPAIWFRSETTSLHIVAPLNGKLQVEL